MVFDVNNASLAAVGGFGYDPPTVVFTTWNL